MYSCNDAESETLLIAAPGYHLSLASNLYRLQQEGLFCEVALRADMGEDFPVHGCVAVAASSFIAHVLKSVDAETSKSSWGFVVPLDNISVKSLTKVTKFMYKGQVDIYPHELNDLQEAAVFLQMPELIEACQRTVTALNGNDTSSQCEHIADEDLEQDIKKESISNQFEVRKDAQEDLKKTITDKEALPDIVTVLNRSVEIGMRKSTRSRKSKILNDFISPMKKSKALKADTSLNLNQNKGLQLQKKDLLSIDIKEEGTSQQAEETSLTRNKTLETDLHSDELCKNIVKLEQVEEEATEVQCLSQKHIEDSQESGCKGNGSLIFTEDSSYDKDNNSSGDDLQKDSFLTKNDKTLSKVKKKIDPRVMAVLKKGKNKLKNQLKACVKTDGGKSDAKGSERIGFKRKRNESEDDEDFIKKSRQDNTDNSFEIEDEENCKLEDVKQEGVLSGYKYQCGECGKIVGERSHLVKHMNFSHPIVDGDGKEKDLKVIHVYKEELSSVKLKCPVCNRAFARRSNWVQHLNFSHRIKIELNSSKKVKIKGNSSQLNSNENDESSLPGIDASSTNTTITQSTDSIQIDSSECHINSEESRVIVLKRKDVDPPKRNNIISKAKKPIVARERVNKECPTCKKFFRFKLQYDDHVIKHKDPKPYKCSDCTASFKERGQLKAHFEVHGLGEKKYQCSGCEKSFSAKSKLLHHEKKHLKRDREYVCDMCGKGFMDQPVLNMHIKHVHNKEYVKCETCSKSISKLRLKEHMNLHTAEKLYRCEYCDTVYRQKKSLECHVKFKHSTDPTENTRCNICNQKFSNPVTLEKHMIRHTGKRNFGCSKCNQKFFTKAEKNNHELTHLTADQRPWPCHVCFKSFVKEASLKSHLLVHSPSKPLSCTYCGKGFRWKNKLKEHIRTHTGEKPHKCRYCETWFADCAVRRYHEKKSHYEQTLGSGGDSSEKSSGGQVLIRRGSGSNVQLIVATEEQINKRLRVSGQSGTDDGSIKQEENKLELDNVEVIPTKPIDLPESVIKLSTMSVSESADNTAVVSQQNMRQSSHVYVSTSTAGTKYILSLAGDEVQDETVVGDVSSSSDIESNTKYILDCEAAEVEEDEGGYIITQDGDRDDKLVINSSEEDGHMVIASEAGVQLAMIGEDESDQGQYVQYILQGEEGQQIQYLVQQGQQTRL